MDAGAEEEETEGRGDAMGVLVFIEVKFIPAKNIALG
jgi:hypothetical protein